MLFVSVNVLGPIPESSSVSRWSLFSVKWQTKINAGLLHVTDPKIHYIPTSVRDGSSFC